MYKNIFSKYKIICSYIWPFSSVQLLSCVRLFVTPWTIACQASLYLGFSRQEYWDGLPFPSPGVFPNPGIEPGSPALQADALPSEPPGKPRYSIRYEKKVTVYSNYR